MLRLVFPFVVALMLAGAAAADDAACYADYKAKQDDPLQLHYGVIALPEPACAGTEAAAGEVARRIAVDGWQLLTIVSVFDTSGLEDRRANAGAYYLRY
ncbi:hypothetical protein DXV76_13005 [Rhodobacteraceae bacterium CCMM004]|nr:hypothetical protein DXV76_13005 [Rhodobacteraceae bacterium CCMM004]